MIRIEQGKGRKDKYTVLSETLLKTLEEYWRTYRPDTWLFSGSPRHKYLSINSAQRIYHKANIKAGVKRDKGIHTLRHSFATHLLKQGTRTYSLQQMLGHKSIRTTARYLHISNEDISKVANPADAMNTKCCEKSSRPKQDIADIFRHSGQRFLENFSASHEQIKIMNHILPDSRSGRMPELRFSAERLQLLQERAHSHFPGRRGNCFKQKLNT